MEYFWSTLDPVENAALCRGLALLSCNMPAPTCKFWLLREWLKSVDTVANPKCNRCAPCRRVHAMMREIDRPELCADCGGNGYPIALDLGLNGCPECGRVSK